MARSSEPGSVDLLAPARVVRGRRVVDWDGAVVACSADHVARVNRSARDLVHGVQTVSAVASLFEYLRFAYVFVGVVV